MKITKKQLKRIVREAMDYDPLGDAGVPHVGVGPKYALAFVDAAYGDRRMELVVRDEDTELARKVMKKLRKQGQTSGVQPTRQRFNPREVTSREELLRLVSEPLIESGGSWRDPINLLSIDSLEAAGREGMASYADIEAARYALPELEDYMEYNYRATLEHAVDAYLEAHGYDDPDSPMAAAREDQRKFLMRIGRERGLDKI